MNARQFLAAGALSAASASVFAAGADLGQAVKQPTNWIAISMFVVFVVSTLFITKWAARKTRSAAEFYTAGGGITGFQNGLAIAGDFMSAASFLGISGLVYANGYRRPDLFDRLSGGLADRHVPDGRAPAQPRPLHVRRCRRLPLRADADPRVRRVRHAGRGGVLSDRADGRRRAAHQAAVRPANTGSRW